jgi:hypothetical protein
MAYTSMRRRGVSTCWPFCTCIDIPRCEKVEIRGEAAGALPDHNARHREASRQVFLKKRVRTGQLLNKVE